MRKFLTVVTAVASCAALAACGSSSKSTSSSSASSAPGSTAAAASKAPYTTGSPAAASGGTAAAGASNAVLVSTKHGALGTVLAVGPKKLTAYLFEGDKGTASACGGACAGVWPPVMAGSAKAGGGASGSQLGTISRPDGTKQVTYNGHPLYFFARDKDSGDSYGQGVKSFGAAWYALAPSGKKVDKS
jgi:predicted lipoprotein with Yx(FWY)xxD motif